MTTQSRVGWPRTHWIQKGCRTDSYGHGKTLESKEAKYSYNDWGLSRDLSFILEEHINKKKQALAWGRGEEVPDMAQEGLLGD